MPFSRASKNRSSTANAEEMARDSEVTSVAEAASPLAIVALDRLLLCGGQTGDSTLVWRVCAWLSVSLAVVIIGPSSKSRLGPLHVGESSAPHADGVVALVSGGLLDWLLLPAACFFPTSPCEVGDCWSTSKPLGVRAAGMGTGGTTPLGVAASCVVASSRVGGGVFARVAALPRGVDAPAMLSTASAALLLLPTGRTTGRLESGRSSARVIGWTGRVDRCSEGRCELLWHLSLRPWGAAGCACGCSQLTTE